MSAPPDHLFSSSWAPPRQVPSRSRSSKFKRDRMLQAEECHALLVQMDQARSDMLDEKVLWLTKKQDLISDKVSNGIAESEVVESFIEHLYRAQVQLVADLKGSLKYDGSYLDEESLSGKSSSDIQSDCTSDSFIVTASMHKSTRLMILKIYGLGVKNLQETLARMRRMSKVLREQKKELEHLGRTVIKAMMDSQDQVQQAWDKYCNDAMDIKIAKNDPDDSGTNVRLVPESTQSHQRKSILRCLFTGSHENSRSSDTNSVENPVDHENSRSRSLSGSVEKPVDHRLSRNNSLRVMMDAADMTCALPTPDIWLSEWSYRAQVLQQLALCNGSINRMKQLFRNIEKSEVMRRIHVQQYLVALASSQQKLAVNLEAAASMALIDYWEAKQALLETTDKKEHDNDKRPNNIVRVFSPSGRSIANLGKSLSLPSLMESAFVALANVAQRADMDGLRPILSMFVITADGLLYFYDLPKDSGLSLKSSNSEAWCAVLQGAFQRQILREFECDGDTAIVVVPPPRPPLSFFMGGCSVEMAHYGSAVRLRTFESHGKGFLILFPSVKIQIAFIDNFRAHEVQDAPV